MVDLIGENDSNSRIEESRMNSGITLSLAKWIARTPRIRSKRALSLAKDAIKDITACMIAGAKDEATLAVLRSARSWGKGSCSIVGEKAKLPAAAAALVNGTAAHALDYDDNFHPMAGHATAVLAPAVFAVAEELNASGHAVLDAYIVGLQAQTVVGEGVNLAHYERGWHSTSTIGVFGTAAACARLRGLDAEGAQAAISLAYSMAAGSKLQFGTMAKPLHSGLAAMHGVMAASLAASGVRGKAEVLEGEWGFGDLFGAKGQPGYKVKPIGKPLAIEAYGLKVKIHPCCASVHTAVDALLALRTEHGFAAGDVERVDVLVNKVSSDNLPYADPRTELEARFSMQWSIALALVQGRLGLADFTPAALKRREIRAWLPKIGMRHTTAGNDHPTADNGREPALTTVFLKDGRKLERYAQHAKGTLQAPLSKAELDAKFEDCAPGRKEVRQMLDGFEKLKGVRPFLKLLSAPPRRRPPSASRGAQARRR
jgi:2-methylcitrate dehydratase PrpD